MSQYQSVYDSISQQSIVNRALELSQADAKKRVARGISAFRRKSFELATMLFNQCCSLVSLLPDFAGMRYRQARRIPQAITTDPCMLALCSVRRSESARLPPLISWTHRYLRFKEARKEANRILSTNADDQR